MTDSLVYRSKKVFRIQLHKRARMHTHDEKESVSALYKATRREYEAYLRDLPTILVNFFDFEVDLKCSRELKIFVRERNITVTSLQGDDGGTIGLWLLLEGEDGPIELENDCDIAGDLCRYFYLEGILSFDDLTRKSRPFLLLGDSILDNRYYADKATGLLLKRGLNVFDHAVEETTTAHFASNFRKVGKPGTNMHKTPITSNSTIFDTYLFPKEDLFNIFVSIGGNDVILGDPQVLQVAIQTQDGDNLGCTLGAKIVEVLERYRRRY